MQASVVWKEGMQFEAVADSGHTVILDAAPAVGGADSGSRPMELIAMGLGGCTAMDVISILRKKRQDVTSFEVQVNAQQAQEHPHVFTAIEIVYLIRGRNVDPAAVERAMQLSEERYCPAQAMLRVAAPITSRYEIVNEAA